MKNLQIMDQRKRTREFLKSIGAYYKYYIKNPSGMSFENPAMVKSTARCERIIKRMQATHPLQAKVIEKYYFEKKTIQDIGTEIGYSRRQIERLEQTGVEMFMQYYAQDQAKNQVNTNLITR